MIQEDYFIWFFFFYKTMADLRKKYTKLWRMTRKLVETTICLGAVLSFFFFFFFVLWINGIQTLTSQMFRFSDKIEIENKSSEQKKSLTNFTI